MASIIMKLVLAVMAIGNCTFAGICAGASTLPDVTKKTRDGMLSITAWSLLNMAVMLVVAFGFV